MSQNRTYPVSAESLASEVVRGLDVRPGDQVCGSSARGTKRDNELEVPPLCPAPYRDWYAKCAERTVACELAVPRQPPVKEAKLHIDCLLGEEPLFVSDQSGTCFGPMTTWRIATLAWAEANSALSRTKRPTARAATYDPEFIYFCFIRTPAGMAPCFRPNAALSGRRVAPPAASAS